MICIIGVGSVGKNLLHCLYNSGKYNKIYIIDKDIITQYNIQYDNIYISKSKVDACKLEYGDIIYPIYEYLDNNNISSKIQDIFQKSSTVFDCRDTFENRVTFDAIKIYINKDLLIADFRKNIIFNYQFEGEYVNYINEHHIKSLISKFVNLFLTSTKIDKYKENNETIALNQLGEIKNLINTNSMISDDIIEMIKYETSNNIIKIDVRIYDGIYQLYNNIFDINKISINNMLNIVNAEIQHLPAIFIMPIIHQQNTLIINIFNQAGGA